MVDTRFWIDDYISSLNPHEKLLFLYFLTNPYTDICGVYELPLSHVAMETAIPRTEIDTILKRFETENKIFYRNGWVAIRNFVKHQLANPKVQRGIEIGLNKAPESLKKILKDSLSIDYQALSHSNLNSNSNSNPKRIAQMGGIDFKIFWDMYPNKKDKKKAEQKWYRLPREVQEKILLDLPLRSQGAAWKKDNGRYIPYPTTYLNGERWNDSIETAPLRKTHDFSSTKK